MAGKSPLKLIHWVLSLGGMTVPPDSKYPRLVRLNCYTQAYNIVVFVITNLYQIFVSDEILEEKLGIGQHVLSSVHIGGKHFNILFRTEKIRHYLNEIEEMWADATEGGKNLDLFEMAHKSSYKSMVLLTSAYVGLVPLIILICLFSNIFSDSSELSLPMKTWTPFTNYWISSFYQLFSFHSIVLSVGISKSFERAIFLQINAQMKVMQRMLFHRRKDEDDFNYKKMYKLHQRILKLVQETNYNFAGQAMLEMALSALQIAMRLSTCITALLGGKPTFAPYFLNLILAMIAPYIICLNGSILTSEGENIYRTAYDNVWYEEKTKSSQDLLVLQSMAIKPVELNYKVVFKFSLVQFTTLMQGSYSYLMMIKYFAEQNGV